MGLKSRVAALFLFLMKGFLPAGGAVFENFHLGGMGLFVAGGNVILIAALGAFQNRLITFASHSSLTSFFSAGILAQGSR